LLAERGLEADHTTIWRWVQRYGPELEQRLRRHLKPTKKSWRVDETYIRVQGSWCYLYRAIDSTGATIDFLLSALRDAAAAKRLFRMALSDPSHPQPRVINTDKACLYGSAIAAVKAEGTLHRHCRHRPVQYLNNILEQDHRAIKRRVKAKQSFREFRAARQTIAGYEAIHMIRKGQRGGSATVMFANKISSSTSCSIWLLETSPTSSSRSVLVTLFKVATHPPVPIDPAPGEDRLVPPPGRPSSQYAVLRKPTYNDC
jgi:IS6 family transposase